MEPLPAEAAAPPAALGRWQQRGVSSLLFFIGSSFRVPCRPARGNRRDGAVGGTPDRGGLQMSVDRGRLVIGVAEDRPVMASVSPKLTAAEPNV